MRIRGLERRAGHFGITFFADEQDAAVSGLSCEAPLCESLAKSKPILRRRALAFRSGTADCDTTNRVFHENASRKCCGYAQKLRRPRTIISVLKLAKLTQYTGMLRVENGSYGNTGIQSKALKMLK